MKKTVWIETYGCTLNQADTDLMKGVLGREGYAFSPDSTIYILNTCTVKEATENKIISRIGKLREEGKKVVIAGCLGINEERIRSAAPGAVIVYPSAASHIAEAVELAARGEAGKFTDGEKEGFPMAYTAPILRIAVQEGCVGNCHFCQTRLARPRLRSCGIKTIKRRVEEGLGKGAREIQLAGQDTGAYGIDNGSSLPAMLGEVLGVEGDFMVRLGMINPGHAREMLPELLGALGHPRFYKFLHLPVQTGSEKVRMEMNRAHSVADFEEVVGRVRERFQECTISTDIIAGYPTERVEDYSETVELLKRVKPDIVNLSKYSSRKGTAAGKLRKLPTQEVKRRSTALSALVKRICTQRNSGYAGREEDVLITEMQKTPTGRMRNYKQVCVRGRCRLGEWVRVKITGYNHGSLFGEKIGQA